MLLGNEARGLYKRLETKKSFEYPFSEIVSSIQDSHRHFMQKRKGPSLNRKVDKKAIL